MFRLSSMDWRNPPARLLRGAVFFITFCAFLPALDGAFVWDDQINFVQNHGFRGLDSRHLRWMATTFLMGPYQPLTWLSYALDYRIWGMEPYGYHLTNLLIHSLNAVLALMLGEELLARGLGRKVPWAAAFAALLFSIHPMRAESVAWITERRDVLYGFFLLLAALAYVRGRRTAALGCYALSLLSKGMGMTFPATLLILDYYPLRRLDHANLKKRLIEKIPFAAMGLAAALVAVNGQMASSNMPGLARHGAPSRLMQAVYGLSFYLRKMIWPTHLSALYPLVEGKELARLLPGAVLFLALAASALRWAGAAAPLRRAAWGYYAAALLPILGLAQNGPQLVALRFSYLPCLGWAFVAGAGAACARKRVIAPLAAAALAGAFAQTWLESRVWRDETSLWTAAYRAVPDSSDVRLNLANAWLREGRIQEAMAGYAQVLVIRPDDEKGLINQGCAWVAQGRLDEAESMLIKALNGNPVSPDAHNCLADIYLRRGDFQDAVAHFETACHLRPDSSAHSNLGVALARAGRSKEARAEFQEALRLNPGNAAAFENLRRLLGKRK